MSYSSKPTDSTTTPSTPLSPFPSTPHRLSYIQHQPFTTNTLDSPIHANPYDPYTQSLTEHISPTKAAQTTRLNHEISTLTAWLETLLDPKGNNGGIPPIFQKWKGEVLSAAAQGSFDGPVPLIGTISPSKPGAPGSGSIFDEQIYTNSNAQSPIRPTQQSRTSSTTTTTTTNNPVLEQLKTLKQVNLSADYLVTLLHEARLEELRILQARQSNTDRQRERKDRARILLDEVYGTLTPDAVDALRSLSESAVTLGIDLDRDLDGTSSDGGVKDLTSLYARGILSEVRRKFILDEQVRELDDLRERIEVDSEGRMSTGKGEDTKDNGNNDNEDGDGNTTTNEQIHAQTAQFNRDTKQINLKIMEYHDRVTSLERQLASLRSQSASLQDVLNARARVEDRRARVKALQERFAAFNGLPPDLEDSRNEVRRAIAELETLKTRREGLFERLGSG